MAIIGISGKIQSGKDLVGKIIQYLTATGGSKDNEIPSFKNNVDYKSDWEIHKFADSLKDIICILTGCTREQLENSEFKNSKLPDEWIRYGYANGFSKRYIGNGNMGDPIMNNKQCDKERYEIERRINWQTAYKVHLTYRELLQGIGTDLFRNQLHEDTWVNTLFSKYKPKFKVTALTQPIGYTTELEYPNWIITDCRFPNECKAVKDRGGIVIRANRANTEIKKQAMRDYKQLHGDLSGYRYKEHSSETALDDYQFDYIINNNSTITDLIIKVKEILIKEKII